VSFNEVQFGFSIEYDSMVGRNYVLAATDQYIFYNFILFYFILFFVENINNKEKKKNKQKSKE